jgi:hypothetical protein
MFGKKKMFFLPWVEKHEEIKEIIQDPKNASDVLFCHTDIRGLSFNRFTKIEEGTEAEVFKSHKRVYSGHIHYAQKTSNIRMLGCPYELTRSDSGNQKSVWLYDLENDEETQFNIVTEEEQKIEDGELVEGEDGGEINLTNLIEKHIDGLHYSEAIKEKLINISKKLYHDALRELEEKRNNEN